MFQIRASLRVHAINENIKNGLSLLLGYGIIAVPIGIYSVELIRTFTEGKVRNDACPDCGRAGQDFDADYCKYCGHALED